MATTLVIKGANFSANKIDTVIITDPIPCTGISFSAASANVDYGGTYTVSYTVTPADTTDAIEWSSDNADFAVNNGVVTIGAVGTATITAICGEYSATITLTSTATYDADNGSVYSGACKRYRVSYFVERCRNAGSWTDVLPCHYSSGEYFDENIVQCILRYKSWICRHEPAIQCWIWRGQNPGPRFKRRFGSDKDNHYSEWCGWILCICIQFQHRFAVNRIQLS